MSKHGKLILQINKALNMLSQKVYTDVLSEVNPQDDYSLLDLLRKCKNELSKIDEQQLNKIVNLVKRETE